MVTSNDQIVQDIRDACLLKGLCYSGESPAQVSPGVWMFHATNLNETCRKSGYCQETTFYAIQLRGKVVIQP